MMMFPRFSNNDNMGFKSRDQNFKRKKGGISWWSDKQTCSQPKPKVPVEWQPDKAIEAAVGVNKSLEKFR